MLINHSLSLKQKLFWIMFFTFKTALQILERIFFQLRSEKLLSTSYTVVSSVLCVYCLSRCPVLYNLYYSIPVARILIA